MLYTVETVSCLGACGLAPVLTVNDKSIPDDDARFGMRTDRHAEIGQASALMEMRTRRLKLRKERT